MYGEIQHSAIQTISFMCLVNYSYAKLYVLCINSMITPTYLDIQNKVHVDKNTHIINAIIDYCMAILS